jgi:hypothetical protein
MAKGKDGNGQITLTCDDQDRLMEDVGFAKGVLDLLYGNMSSAVASMDLTGSVSYVVSEARDRLEKTLETISGRLSRSIRMAGAEVPE